MPIIARVIDILPSREVVLIAEHEQFAVAWSGFAPHIGEVFEVEFSPAFKVVRKLSSSEGLKKNGDAMRWRHPDALGRTRMEALHLRHTIKRAVRDYLDAQGFLEVDMPLLVHGTTPDEQIDSFEVGDRYLVSSTEYQIKRMEIGGFDKLYTLTQNYRMGDLSRYRNPEFTMLEWARVGQTLQDIEHDMEQMAFAAHKALGGTGIVEYQGHKVNLTPPWNHMSVSNAIKGVTGITIEDFSIASLLKPLLKAGIEVRDDAKNDQVFLFTILLDHIQKYLGFDRPVFLRDWPSFLSSATPGEGKQTFIERSELFIAGVELSDGFPSLTDQKRQAAGFAEHNARKKKEGKKEVKLDEKYLAAFSEGFPSGAGMALGFDRLVMILTDRPDIASVLAYGWNEL